MNGWSNRLRIKHRYCCLMELHKRLRLFLMPCLTSGRLETREKSEKALCSTSMIWEQLNRSISDEKSGRMLASSNQEHIKTSWVSNRSSLPLVRQWATPAKHR